MPISDLKALLKNQRKFFSTGKTRGLEYRLEQLRKLHAAITKHELAIIEALRADLGKPKFEAITTEISYVLNDIKHVMKNLKCWVRVQKVSSPLFLKPAHSEIRYEPYGVSLVLAPWNYPFQLLMGPLVGAIAAGNCVVVKPSELAPKTQEIIVKIISEIFSPEYIAPIMGAVEESKALLAEKFDFIFFTGSTQVGRNVMLAAAQNLTPVCLELGGKSPCIVEPDVDLHVAARRIIWGKFSNAGQTCVAPDYLYVHEQIKTKFVEVMLRTLKDFYGENPKLSESYARIINDRHLQRLKGLLIGVKIITGGEIDFTQKYMAPTLVENVTWDSPIMQEEIFGPVLPVLPYQNLNDVLLNIESRPKPLAMYIFTKNTQIQNDVLERLSYGGACVNDTLVHLGNPELPFGGVGESGMGAYHGFESFAVFSHKKSVLRKPFFLDSSIRYAPYTEAKLKWLRFFLG